MKRGVLLSVCWAALAFLLFPGVSRSAAPPNCEDCECFEADAWIEVWYEGTPPVQKTSNTDVLKAWDAKNPEEFGAVLLDARWFKDLAPPNFRRVYATPCLKDFTQEETSPTFKRLTYTDNWPRQCKVTATQQASCYQPVVYDANSTSYSVNGVTGKRFSCGPQD